MRPKLAFRIVVALLALILFGAYMHFHLVAAPYSEDIGEPGGTYEPWSAANKYPDQKKESAAPEETAVETEEETAAEAASAPEPTPEATPEPTVDPNSPYGQALANAAAQNLPTPPEIDVNSWEFVLVNADHSIGEYEPEQLGYLNQVADDSNIVTEYDGNRCPVDIRIAQPLLDFALGCKEAGLPVYLSSGYRSYFIQGQNFQRVCANNGVSDGKTGDGYYITMPAGCSEHQTGLGIDITDRYYEIKNDSIMNTPTIQWLIENCSEYGFVLRFPADKKEITQVMGESWHFRYVGKEVAQYMTANNLCLEEFLALYGVK